MSENKHTAKCLDCLKPGAGNDKHMLIGFKENSGKGVYEYHSWKVGTDPNIIREDIITTLAEEMNIHTHVHKHESNDQYECYRFGMKIFGTSKADIEEKIVSELKTLNLSELINLMDNDDSCFPMIFIPVGDMNKLIMIASLIINNIGNE